MCRNCKGLEEDMEVVLKKHLSTMMADIKKDLADHISKELSSMKDSDKSDSKSDSSIPPPPALVRQSARYADTKLA